MRGKSIADVKISFIEFFFFVCFSNVDMLKINQSWPDTVLKIVAAAIRFQSILISYFSVKLTVFLQWHF